MEPVNVVEFGFNLNDRVTHRQSKLSGWVTSCVKTTEGIGYWVSHVAGGKIDSFYAMAGELSLTDMASPG